MEISELDDDSHIGLLIVAVQNSYGSSHEKKNINNCDVEGNNDK